jgi:hypothetical protein
MSCAKVIIEIPVWADTSQKVEAFLRDKNVKCLSVETLQLNQEEFSGTPKQWRITQDE